MLQRHDLGDLDLRVTGVLLDSLVHRRLESPFVDDQVGRRDLGDLAGGEFEMTTRTSPPPICSATKAKG
jgi:hypothetical protein